MRRFSFLKMTVIAMALIFSSGCFIFRNAKDAELTATLIELHSQQKNFQISNSRWAVGFQELDLKLTKGLAGYAFGQNPKCVENSESSGKNHQAYFGTIAINPVTKWLKRQVCRSGGYVIYAIKMNGNTYEIHQINDRKEIKFNKVK